MLAPWLEQFFPDLFPLSQSLIAQHSLTELFLIANTAKQLHARDPIAKSGQGQFSVDVMWVVSSFDVCGSA